MELKDTVNLMLSEDFKDRLKAEYFQLEDRYKSLNEYITFYNNDNQLKKDIENGKITDNLTKEIIARSPFIDKSTKDEKYFSLLTEQSYIMETYLSILQQRLELLGVDINE